MVLANAPHSTTAWSLRRLVQSVGPRADAAGHLLRAPLFSRSRDAQLLYLCDLYGFFYAFETSCAEASSAIPPPGESRARSTHIAGELSTLGIGPTELATIAARFPVPRWDQPLDALGWLFVVDRLDVVHRALPAGDRQVQALLHHVTSERDMRRVIHAASQALEALEDWMLATAARSANLAIAQVRFA
jgi:heme oxygenase